MRAILHTLIYSRFDTPYEKYIANRAKASITAQPNAIVIATAIFLLIETEGRHAECPPGA